MATENKSRRNDIDWLRAFAVYLLFFFHVGKVYDAPPFYQIKNAVSSEFLGYFTGFIHIWHMPLFFLLAGWSVFSSLKRRGGGEFFKERVKRILVPFLAGCVVLCPPMQFVYAKTAMNFQGSYLEFLSLFFTSLKYFSWSHLWFLIYLFTFTLLYYKLFAYISRREDKGGNIHPALVYLPIIVLLIIQLTLRPIWPGFQNLVDDWANFTYYSTFFIMGFLFSRYPAYEAAMHRQTAPAGIVALCSLLGMLAISLLGAGGSMIELAVFAVASYCSVIFLLGLGHRLLVSYEKGLPYIRESAYPVYILHQSSIVLPGFFIVGLGLPIFVKYWISFAAAVSSTFVVYHFLVRPFKTVRFFFGMK